MPRKTRPVKCPVKGPRTELPRLSTASGSREGKGRPIQRRRSSKKKDLEAQKETTIAALGIQDRVETGAILRSHRHDLEVGEDSANPCLVAGARNVISGREPAAQGANRPVLLGFTEAVTRRCGDAAGVLAVASEPSAEPEILRSVTVSTSQASPPRRAPQAPLTRRDHPGRTVDGSFGPCRRIW